MNRNKEKFQFTCPPNIVRPSIFKTKVTTERQEKRLIEAKIDQELRGTENLQHAQTVVGTRKARAVKK